MAEYFEKEAALKLIRERAVAKYPASFYLGIQAAASELEHMPAADVQPVVHAKWIDGADSFGAKRGRYRVCSRCNICIPCVSELAAPYWRGCPNCLARMDGGGNG